jgi:hypothetical protein
MTWQGDQERAAVYHGIGEFLIKKKAENYICKRVLVDDHSLSKLIENETMKD